MESFEEIGTETKSSPIILTDDWFWRVLLRSWLMPLAAAIQVSVKCSIKDLVFELKGGFGTTVSMSSRIKYADSLLAQQ